MLTMLSRLPTRLIIIIVDREERYPGRGQWPHLPAGVLLVVLHHINGGLWDRPSRQRSRATAGYTSHDMRRYSMRRRDFCHRKHYRREHENDKWTETPTARDAVVLQMQRDQSEHTGTGVVVLRLPPQRTA